MKFPESIRNISAKFITENFKIHDVVPLSVVRNEHSPTVSAIFCFRDGVAYEPRDLWGVSHFIEHMLFRGTEKYPTLYDISRRIEGLGGHISAFSTRNMTAHWVKVPAGSLNDSLEVLSQLFTHPLFKDEAIKSEREIIIQERYREINNPGFYSSLMIENLLLLPSPISRHPIGSDAVINHLDGAALSDYVKKSYNRSNMAVAVAGNVNSDILKNIEGCLAEFSLGDVRPKADFSLQTELTESSVVIKPSHHSSQVYLSLGWKFPVKNRREFFIWRAINTLLGAGYTSLLNWTLREKENITYIVTTGFNVYGESGVFKINLALKDDKLAKALGLIDGIIDDLKKGKIPQDIFDEAVLRHGTGTLFKMEDSLEAAKLLGNFLIYYEQPFAISSYLESLGEVTLQEASYLASLHLNTDNKKVFIQTGSEVAKKMFPHGVNLEAVKEQNLIFS